MLRPYLIRAVALFISILSVAACEDDTADTTPDEVVKEDSLKNDTTVVDTVIVDTTVIDTTDIDTVIVDTTVVDTVIVDTVVTDTVTNEDTTVVVNPYPGNTNKWTTIQAADGSQPVERHEAAFIEVKNKFYLLGGRGIRPVSIFDPATQKWSEGAKPPKELHHFQPIVWDDKVYILGAFTGGFPRETPTANIYIYDPAVDTWSVGAEVPANRRRGSAGVVVYDNKFYVACGVVNGHTDGHQKWFDVYDPATNSWSVLPDAPRERDHFQAVVADHKLYLAAGRLSKVDNNVFANTIGEVDVYDFKSGQWTTLADPIPTQRAGTAATLYKGEVIIAGGESDKQNPAHSEVEALNPDSHQWHAMPPLVEGRHGSGLIVWKGMIFIASGCGIRGGKPELKTMEYYSE
ncbi:galactose oxidase [Limibacter armeniacum]|uniref:Kelch repeat-containing protein n=1 Tax=Limibacter armeniacum TaxID=466084 RepID=UPI002FE60782